MERKIYYIIVILLLININSKASEYKNRIYKAYISSNMLEWKSVMENMETQKTRNNEFVLEMLNYQYGYIGWCIGNKKYSEAEYYIALGEKNINFLEKANYKLSLVNSYKAAFYGYRIGLNKMKAPFIGPKSIEHAKTAIEIDANNPFGYIQLGNSDYYMPAAFGGSKTRAIQYYKKAAKLMESDASTLKNDWNYLGLLTQIAIACEELELYSEAKNYYRKILEIEPAYKWVKDELYPAFLEKTN